jgi:lactoylglutathione lyase
MSNSFHFKLVPPFSPIRRKPFWAWMGASCLALGLVLGPDTSRAQENNSAFASKIFDLGVVVSDINKSVKFYTEAIGFKQLDGFKVPAGFATDSGLTDNKDLDIKVLVLGEGDNATKLKLMQVPGVRSQPTNNRHIHSQLGFSYISIFVTDIDQSMERLKKAGASLASKGANPLPEGFPQGIYMAVVKDPDGNLIELIGPKK